jgi:NDP-sugar pyrophosphorylase family protein
VDGRLRSARRLTRRHALRGTPTLIEHALILTAGLGTRLQPLTAQRAKPAMPVAGEPMIRRIITWLAGHGVHELVLNLHHLPDTLTAVVGDGSDLGVRVRYSWEQPAILGSGGGPRRALPIVGADPFFIVNGDTLTDVDLGAMSAAHAASGALVTLALVPNREFTRYGGVIVDGDGRVTGFARRGPESEGTWHFIGVQVAQASVFAPLGDGFAGSSIGGVYNDLIRVQPGSVHAFRCDAAFWDVGTAADYWRTSQAFSTTGVDAGRRTTIDDGARVTSSVLWDDVEIGAGAVVDSCIVTDGVRVAPGAHYTDAILLLADDGREGPEVLPLGLRA